MKARGRLVETIESEEVLKKMDAYDREKEKKSPLIKVVRQYMNMVLKMMTFSRAVRNGNWTLHLEALKSLSEGTGL